MNKLNKDDQDVQDVQDVQDEQDEQEPDEQNEQNEHQIWPNLGLEDGHAWSRMGKHVTKLISLYSYEEHFLKVSSKSDEPNSRYIEKGIFWD